MKSKLAVAMTRDKYKTKNSSLADKCNIELTNLKNQKPTASIQMEHDHE